MRVYVTNDLIVKYHHNWPVEPKHKDVCQSSVKKSGHVCYCADLAFEEKANRDVVDWYDDNCPRKYEQALKQAIAEAVPFEDQGAVKRLLTDWIHSELKPGFYEVRGIGVKVVTKYEPCPKCHEGFLKIDSFLVYCKACNGGGGINPKQVAVITPLSSGEKEEQLLNGLYKKPFVYDDHGQMIFDANNNHVLDIRGWGRIQYQENGMAKQDAFGRFVTKLLNEHYGK
jgi:hypothetical protein